MPRQKSTRNAQGTILTRTVTIDGKKTKIFIARKRYPRLDAAGNIMRGPDGRRLYRDKNQTCRTHAEAVIALANLPTVIENERAASATERPRTSATFFDLIAYFKTEYLKAPIFVGDRQLAGYRQDPKKISKMLDDYAEFFGDVRLSSITYEDVRSYAEHLATTPFLTPSKVKKMPRPATINRKLAYLRRLFNIGKQKQWLAVNPFALGKPLINISAERARERVLSFDEEERLFAACHGKQVVDTTRKGLPLRMTFDAPREHLDLILILAIDAGLRKAEIFSLEYDNVDFGKHIITVEARKTKALKRRIIPMSDRLESALREHFTKFGKHSSGLVFRGLADCKRAFRRACEVAGIEDLHFHDLRHTAASWMDEAGLSQAVKQNILGHTSDAVHQRYHNPTADILRSAREKMNEFRERIEEERAAARKRPKKVVKIR